MQDIEKNNENDLVIDYDYKFNIVFFFYFYLNIIYEGGKICLNKIS